MTANAVIFGCEGLSLTDWERKFFADSNPCGFILFARNCESPEQIRALIADLRETIGRSSAPVLIDQEGGRVARLRPPHWRRWQPVLRLFDGADEVKALEATRLRYRIIAGELVAVGIDVDCEDAAGFRHGCTLNRA